MKVITSYIKNSTVSQGGNYRRLMELIRALTSRGWEVHHISPRGFTSVQHENLIHHGIRNIPLRPSLFPYLLQTLAIMLLVGRKANIDAMISFTLFGGLMGVLYRLFHRKTKAIVCDRGSTIAGVAIENQNKPRFLLLPLLKALDMVEKFTYRRANLIIFNSEMRREEITNKITLGDDRIRVIHNNANPSWVTEEKIGDGCEIRKVSPNKKIIGFVGNLWLKGRDLDTLIKAFRIVKAELPDSLLVLVGDGPDRRELVSLAKSLGLKNDVILTGFKSNPLPYMRESDILVVTALHESFSNTILEALYCEALVIGSKVGGIPEALGYEELLFPPREEAILAEKIINLLKDKKANSRALRLLKARRKLWMFDWNDEMIEAIKGAIKPAGECMEGERLK